MTRANGVLHPGATPARGFSLIDLAIVMTIVGVLLAGFLTTYKLYQTTHAMAVTEQNFNAVQEAIGAYISVQKHYPVPAGYGLVDGETGYGLSASAANITTCGSTPGHGKVCKGGNGVDSEQVLVGLVPFSDLNLAPEQARDGYGRLFTYAVSQALTVASADPNANGSSDLIDEANYHVCIKKHVIDTTAGTSVDVNCEVPGPANVDTGEWRDGVDYKTGNIVSYSCVTYRAKRDHKSESPHTSPPPATPGNVPGTDPTTWEVYDFNPLKPMVVISHGRDGKGAWLPGGGRYLSCGGGVQAENCNYDGIFATSVTKPIPATGSQPAVCSTRALSTSAASADDDDMRTEAKEDVNLWAQISDTIANRYSYKVGIGVSTPQAPLDVNGAIKADKMLSNNYCNDSTTCIKTASIVDDDDQMKCSDIGLVASIVDNKVTCSFPSLGSDQPSSEGVPCQGQNVYIAGFDTYNPICQVMPVTCGTAHQTETSQAPSTPNELCRNGTPSAVAGSNPWHWSCTGGTNTVNCSTVGGAGKCTDECGQVRNNGDTWCKRSVGSGLMQCNNGNLVDRGSIGNCPSGLQCP